MHPQLYSAAEVAEILGVQVATLAQKWRRLHASHGFPRPIPGRPDAWSRVLVDEWIATPAGQFGRGDGKARRERAIAEQRSALEARYAGGVH